MIHLVMVFRRRSGNSLRPVNRIKHVVDTQQGGVGGTQIVNSLIVAVDAPTIGVTTQVQTGSTVNAIYLKFEVNPINAAALPNFYIAIVKNPGNNLTFPDANVIGGDDNKKYVIHQEMVMLQAQANGNPRTVFNGVIVIPKGYRRFGPADRLQLLTLSPGITTNQCFQCHYKEFR